ncbi:MAG: hypothetical protein GC204_07390 [Chloroflexi bacterium]|nr:hypothetical protein [Chloroflexota bacterium]
MLSPILACTSVSAAIDYYTQKLGFTLEWSMPAGESGQTEFASVKLGDAELLLGITHGFVEPEDLDKRGIGIQLYIQLPEALNIDDLYTHAQSRNAHITRAIETRDWGERAFNVRDLDGYNLMIAQQVQPSS